MVRYKTDTDFFSDDQMKHRDPLLYEQMIGNFLSKEEMIQARNTDMRLSSMITQHMDIVQDNAFKETQKEYEARYMMFISIFWKFYF